MLEPLCTLGDGSCFSQVFLAVLIVKPNPTSNAKLPSISTLSLPRVPKFKIQDESQISFSKIHKYK